MLKTVAISRAAKTAGCAVTYRAGGKDKFGTCPKHCELNASGKGCAPSALDFEYLDAVLDAKPRRGFSFTYSHFSPLYWAHKLAPNKTVINYSATGPASASQTLKRKLAPVVTVVGKDWWRDKRQRLYNGVRFVRCPAEYNKRVNCANCGADKGPLCARPDRNFVVTFTAHGASKKRIETGDRGGCYADGGNVRIHWQETSDQPQDQNDAETLREFVRTLPSGAVLRHHVAGDFGLEG